MNKANTIFDYITAQESEYKKPIRIFDNWEWNMHEHIRMATLYKHGQLMTGSKEFKPVKNIVKPILNLQYRAEGFDVKDITLYIDDSKKYFKSFLVKKFHEQWARENHLDTVIDAMVESYVDFGGALLKNVNDVKPEVVPLASIVFCDQTDMLGAPIGFKHFYSAAQLLEMKKVGWGNPDKGADTSIEDAIYLVRNNPTKEDNTSDLIPVYEVHGQLPKSYFDAYASSEEYDGQMHIVMFYQNKDGEKRGITIFKGKESKLPFKLIKRDPIHGRALGFGGVEELEDPQVWTNYGMIRVHDMMDAASKTILVSTDPTITNKNKVKDMENLEILDLTAGTDIKQLDTFPRNIKLFEESNEMWEAHGQKIGSAQEAILGEEPKSGTPLGSVQIQQLENHSLHNYRQGKLATFWSEVETDWILPHISREITKDQEFLAELDLKEMQYVAQSLVQCETNKFIKDKILNGELINPEDVEGYKEIVRGEFKKRGNKHFIKILGTEMKNAPLAIEMSILGKQKNLAKEVDQINAIIRTVLQAGGPMALAAPATWDVINQSIEKSGLNPVDFSELADGFKKLAQQQAQQQQMQQMAPEPQPAY